jgi:small-conductance mechanosensitive channel
MTTDWDQKYDIVAMVAKPLYVGMLFNILLPMGLLLVCYYINTHYPLENRLGGSANSLFYAFVVLGLAQAGLSLWWRTKRLERPMVRREETFEEDILGNLVMALRPVFLQIAAISVYGYAYFFLTGRFVEAVVFVFGSFLVFQVVRPRQGSIRKLLEHQQELLEQGKNWRG